jgi:hypothetical protein
MNNKSRNHFKIKLNAKIIQNRKRVLNSKKCKNNMYTYEKLTYSILAKHSITANTQNLDYVN